MRALRGLALFDIDGTLLHSTAADEDCFLGAFAAEFGIRDVDADWSRYPEVTDPVVSRVILTRALGREPRPEETARVERRFVALLGEAAKRDGGGFAEVAGARELLTRLRGGGPWAAALATGAWATPAAHKLEVAGLAALDLPLATADDDETRTGILRVATERAAARHGVDFERRVAVGDGVWDVRAAARLGLPFIGVGSGARERVLRDAGARHVVADFRPLDRFLRLLDEAEPPSPPTSG